MSDPPLLYTTILHSYNIYCTNNIIIIIIVARGGVVWSGLGLLYYNNIILCDFLAHRTEMHRRRHIANNTYIAHRTQIMSVVVSR